MSNENREIPETNETLCKNHLGGQRPTSTQEKAWEKAQGCTARRLSVGQRFPEQPLELGHLIRSPFPASSST